MNKILFCQSLIGLSNQTGRLTGAFTSIVDAFININKYKSVKLKTFLRMSSTRWVDLCFKNKQFGSPKIVLSSTWDNKFHSEIIVCSGRFLLDIILYKLDVKCDKLIILDSFDIACPRYFPEKTIVEKDIPTKNYILLANKANLKRMNNSYEYYHKFSKERLGTLTFEEDKFFYSRKDKWYIKNGKRSWFENIGKGIFERLYHNVEVYYSTKGMKQKDGLYYYINLFGIDGEKNQYPLEISKNDIEEKLLMKEDDLLLKLL